MPVPCCTVSVEPFGALNTTRSIGPGRMTAARRLFSTSFAAWLKTTAVPFSAPGTHVLPSYDGACDHGAFSSEVNVSVARQATTDTCGGGDPSMRKVSAVTRSVG